MLVRPTLRQTALCEEHERLGARMTEFAGWTMPLQYSGILREHQAVRTACGLFDISHMGQILVGGPAALTWLNGLLTNDIARLQPGQAQYSLLCHAHGGVIDDLYGYRLAEDQFLLVVNASRIERVLQWLSVQRGEQTVRIENRSDRTAALALQGPNAPRLLDAVLPGLSKRLRRNQAAGARFGDHEILVARTGYTGEDGFELFLPTVGVVDLWRRLLAEGATPCGLGARDTLRLEMGYPLYGNELTESTTPIEAGLEAFVIFDKGPFLGKETLQQQKRAGIEKRLVAFRMQDQGAIPRSHQVIRHDGLPVGEVTSGTLSPSLQIGIGLGYVKAQFAEVGSLVEVEIRGRRAAAQIVRKPFYKAGIVP